MKHLLSINDLGDGDLNALLNLADSYADKLADPGFEKHVLGGRRILALFFENSTRTSISFEMAARRLGADWISMDMDRSSLSKGESLRDTVLTLQNIVRPAAMIVRHSDKDVPQELASYAACPVINAGNNAHEHPTQALLDALTIRRAKNTLDGLNVAICGDVAHSRVAGSNMALLPCLGANVRVIAPDFFMPDALPKNIEGFTSMEDSLPGCDIVMMLRIQKERISSSDFPDPAAYHNQYGLTRERLALANKDALVMHPGPMNRDVEIAGDIADDPDRSLILTQVANGVPTRMAVIEYLLKDSL